MAVIVRLVVDDAGSGDSGWCSHIGGDGGGVHVVGGVMTIIITDGGVVVDV